MIAESGVDNPNQAVTDSEEKQLRKKNKCVAKNEERLEKLCVARFAGSPSLSRPLLAPVAESPLLPRPILALVSCPGSRLSPCHMPAIIFCFRSLLLPHSMPALVSCLGSLLLPHFFPTSISCLRSSLSPCTMPALVFYTSISYPGLSSSLYPIPAHGLQSGSAVFLFDSLMFALIVSCFRLPALLLPRFVLGSAPIHVRSSFLRMMR